MLRLALRCGARAPACAARRLIFRPLAPGRSFSDAPGIVDAEVVLTGPPRIGGPPSVNQRLLQLIEEKAPVGATEMWEAVEAVQVRARPDPRPTRPAPRPDARRFLRRRRGPSASGRRRRRR